jgi:hypothetical protein
VKFEDDLVEEVMAAAPPGVIFEAEEVCDALVRAVNGQPFIIFPTAVQRAANLAVRRRRAAEEAAGATAEETAGASS